MRFAHVTPFFQPKYYASNEYFVCREMAELGHDVVLFCPDRSPRWQSLGAPTRSQVGCEKYDGFTIQRISADLVVGGMTVMLNLVPALIKQKFDIIHSHEYFSFCSFQSAIAAEMTNRPLVITQHNDQLPASLFNRFNYILDSYTLGKYSLYEAKKIIALTDDIRLHLLRMGASRTKIEVIPNAVDTTLFSPDHRNLLEIKWKISPPVILFVGRLVAEKRVDLLIQAFSEVIKEVPDAKLVIVGRGPKENELRNLQKQLQINNITFIGRIESKLMPNIYAGCDVLVLPSLREPFGNVVIEAMATGKPVIGSYVGGIKDIIVHEKTGYLVKPKNTEKISDFLLKILSDDNLKKKLGRNARERIIKHYSYEAVIKRIEKLYLIAIS